MGTLLANDFSSYELTSEEEREGKILTITQIEVLQTERAAIATDLIEERQGRTDVERAYLRGQLDTYRKILAGHFDAVASKFNEAKAAAEFSQIKPPMNLDVYEAFKQQNEAPQNPETPSNLK